MNLKIILISFLVCLFGCIKPKCSVNFNNFSSRAEAPIIYITSKKENCVYFFSGLFWGVDGRIDSKGEMYFEKDGIYLILDSLKNSKIKYFDFSVRQNEEYLISIISASPRMANIENRVRLDNVLTSQSGINTFVFRVFDGFYSFDHKKSDIVFFVTRDKGVIGSYFSDFENEREIVVSPRGDILRDLIDYSQKDFRIIE